MVDVGFQPKEPGPKAVPRRVCLAKDSSGSYPEQWLESGRGRPVPG
jgi:hypothetical protein